MELQSIVHGQKPNRYTFYVVKDAPHKVAVAVFRNAAHFFETSDDLNKDSMEDSVYRKFKAKVKNKFGVGKIVEHTGVRFNLSKNEDGTMAVTATQTTNGVAVDSTDFVYELLAGSA